MSSCKITGKFLSTFLSMTLCLGELPGQMIPTGGNIKLKADAFYLVTRKNRGKSAAIIMPFLKHDTGMTHVGIAYVQHDGIWVQHVTDQCDPGKPAQRREPLDSFWNSQENTGGAIWQWTGPYQSEQSLASLLDSCLSLPVVFDYHFRLFNGHFLYCSEFCASLMEKMNFPETLLKPAPFSIQDSLIQKWLGCNTWLGYPPDFFRASPFFEPVFQWKKGSLR